MTLKSSSTPASGSGQSADVHGRVLITFHGVGEPPRVLDPGERDVWCQTSVYLSILDAIQGCSWVEVTFDDGNRSDIDLAARPLVDRGVSATFFVLAGRLRDPHYLDAGAIRELIAMGMCIGLHGMHHRPWRRMSTADVNEEITRATAILQEITNQPVDQAACPFGAYDRRSLAALKQAGMKRVLTSDGGMADPSRWLQPRTSIRAGDTSDSVHRMIDRARRQSPFLRDLRTAIKQWR